MPEDYSDALSRRDNADGAKTGLLYRFSSLQIYAAGFRRGGAGIARGTLDAFIELARDKIPRGARRPCATTM